ncbi:MAG: TIGR00730 family Rossman fold protein [Candidatus Aminicenantes bacterium]|nr:TIGR00730 family Rossman fold protein [Candidatus Aminicenantes bacterium]
MPEKIKKEKIGNLEKAYKNLEFLNSPAARSIRILSEYIEPLERLNKFKIKNTVLFLGSARANPDNKDSKLYSYYWEAEKLAYKLADWAIQLKVEGKNFVIITGGGPGIMEAANRGVDRAGGKSIGMNISLPHEQFLNEFIPKELCFVFHYFFMRKFWLLNAAKAVIAFPGGFGTLDEFFETMTLVQTGKIDRKELRILLFGEDYWKKIVDFNTLIDFGTISPQDLELFKITSSVDQAFEYLQKNLVDFI